MVRYDGSEPGEVVDRLLYREAQQMLQRHAGPGPDDRCRWCGLHWPCPARRLAERAATAARQPRPESWPVPTELNTTPSWRAPHRVRGSAANGGLFD